jgi:hypothetical protein
MTETATRPLYPTSAFTEIQNSDTAVLLTRPWYATPDSEPRQSPAVPRAHVWVLVHNAMMAGDTIVGILAR